MINDSLMKKVVLVAKDARAVYGIVKIHIQKDWGE